LVSGTIRDASGGRHSVLMLLCVDGPESRIVQACSDKMSQSRLTDALSQLRHDYQ
jgi:hypothetical protein